MTDIATILLPFAGTEAETPALETAFRLAGIFSSQVSVLHIIQDSEDMLHGQFLGGQRDDVIKMITARNKIEQEAAQTLFESTAGRIGIEQDDYATASGQATTYFQSVTAEAEALVSVRGRLADLIVIGRPPGDTSTFYTTATTGALFGTGRPVLIIPPDSVQDDIDIDVVIAWNGSVQAARAVVASLPLLRRAAKAGKVWVLSDWHKSDNSIPITGEELCLYLKQHDIDAEACVTDTSKGFSTPAAIVEKARELNAGMVVMGAYGHSRMREMVLGGVTQFMLEKADIPILMTH